MVSLPRVSVSHRRESRRALGCALLLLLCALRGHAPVAAAPQSFKLAFFNIRSGIGQPGLPGAPATFAETSNCTDATKPLNAWGVGAVQAELVSAVRNDVSVVALGLAEAWTCASPKAVQQVLGWPASSGERNGVALLARYGFAAAPRWQQLDTSRTTNPADTMWVVAAPVCLDGACSQSVQVFAAHWGAVTAIPADTYTVYDTQADQTLSFLEQLPEGEPRVLIGDLNTFEGTSVVCTQGPSNRPSKALRARGYLDAWPAVMGPAEGYTGMWNRSRCGSPEGYLWKRIDQAWSRFIAPVSTRRFGMVSPGQGAPSDHAGIVVEYPVPATLMGTLPPTAAISTPAENASVAGSVTVQATAADDQGIARVEFLIDGITRSVSATPPYIFTWNTTLIANGAHELTVAATDVSGNRSVSLARQVTVENVSNPGDEIVMHATEARVVGTEWRLVPSPGTASGSLLLNDDLGAAVRQTAASAPASYVEFTFTATAGRPYRIWLRGSALNDSPANDSAYLQFDGAVTMTGAPLYRIGTTAAMPLTGEECDGCGIHGWGWRDGGFPLDVVGPTIVFATTGLQRLRIQAREDGFALDEVALSAVNYRWRSPGLPKDDVTILPSTSPSAPNTPPPLPSGWQQADIGAVGRAGSASYSNGTWTVSGSGTDVWGTADQLRFVSQPLTGDGDISARVVTVPAVNDWTKAGVMIRNSASADSAHAFMLVTPGAAKGLAFQRRVTTGGISTNTSSGGTPPAWVRLSRAGNVISAYRSADGVSWVLVGRDTFTMGATVQVGLAVTSHDNSQLASATFDNVRVTPAAAWSQADIGGVGRPGNGSENGGTWTVNASGTDIWGAADEFRYVYQRLVGNGEIVARVSALQKVNDWTKAGVMIRETLSPGSQHAFMLVTPTGVKGLAFQRRIVTNGVSTNTSGGTGSPPAWVRLARTGNTISAYRSNDGTTWTLVGTDTFTMSATVNVGLAVTSHDNTQTATAAFDNVRVTQSAP